MLREDTPLSDIKDDVGTQLPDDGEHPFEHMTCPAHSGYKLQLLCTKANFIPSLLCIKCLIDPSTQKITSADNLVYIRDTVGKGLSNHVSESQIQAAKEKLEKKFTEFTSVNHIGNYELHSDIQLKKLEGEITGIKECLDHLYSQFKQFFEKQFKFLQDKQDGLTMKIKEFIVEQEEVDNLRNSSPKQIIEAIRGLSDISQYERLVKALHYRGNLNEGVTEGTILDEIFKIIDELKSNVSFLMDFTIETSQLKEIKQRVESMEFMDQNIQMVPDRSSSSEVIMQTLEKIRNAGNNKSFLSPQKNQEKDILGHLQDNYIHPDEKKAQPQTRSENLMQIELPSRFEFNVKRERMSECKGRYSGSPQHSNPARSTLEAETQTTSLQNAGTNTSHDDKYYKRREVLNLHRQKINGTSYRLEKSSREMFCDMNFHEEGYVENDDNGAYYSKRCRRDDELALNNFENREVYSRPQRLDNNLASNSQNACSNQTMNRRDIKQEFHRSPYKQFGRGRENYYPYPHPMTLDGEIKAEAKEKAHGQNYKRRKMHGHRGQYPCDEAYVSSNEEEDDTSNELIGFPRPTRKRRSSGGRIHGLHDWINRRITGYLIFQNTIQGTLEKDREHQDRHLNQIAGEKWKMMSKAEREEYKSLALKVRVDLKKEFRDVDKDCPELKELQKLIEKEVIKVKKVND